MRLSSTVIRENSGVYLRAALLLEVREITSHNTKNFALAATTTITKAFSHCKEKSCFHLRGKRYEYTNSDSSFESQAPMILFIGTF